MKIWHDTSQTLPSHQSAVRTLYGNTNSQSGSFYQYNQSMTLAIWILPGGKGDKLCSVLTLNKRLQSTCCAPTTSLAVWQNGSIQIIFRPSLPIVQNCPPFPEKFMIRHFYQLNNKITGVKTVGVKTTSFFSSNWIRQVAMRCVLWSQICYGQIWFLCSSCCFTFHFFHIISHWCNKQSS